ncbi:MAG: class I SAM-dependent methyltransferase [Armatimonadetes bacterium]|nr:class I SAM-dependent methyltransferase [Armatimonadota bacterium]
MRMCLLLLLFVAAPLGAQHHHDFGDVKRAVRMFEDPARATWQKPDEVVAALRLQSGDVVADIGASTGYFSRRIARVARKVLALDVEPTLVAYMAERARKENQPNLVARVVKPDDPELAANSVDLVLIVDTVHHIENRAAYYPKIKKALKKNGRLAVVDFQARPTPVGPPPEMRISRNDMIAEAQRAGFVLKESPDFLPYQYFLVFGK